MITREKEMKYFKQFNLLFLLIILISTNWHCIEKYPLPPQKDITSELTKNDTLYIQQEPVWDAAHGYDFNAPEDILVGWDTWIYVADTKNNRIVALDLYGNRQGISQKITNPVALAQDDSLNLFVACNNNILLRINLQAAQHNLAAAKIDTIYHDVDHPARRFTGICAFRFQTPATERTLYSRYYVTATGPEAQDNRIFFFRHDDLKRPQGHVPLEYNGFGLMAAASPSSIARYYEGKERQDERGLYQKRVDFVFTQIGQNFFKVQCLTTGSEQEYIQKYEPYQGNIDLLTIGKFQQPEDVTVDGEFNLYVIDAAKDSLFKFSSSGKEWHSFGGTGNGANQFKNPQGVAHHDKTLYIADTGNNRIVRFKLSTDIK